MIHLKISFIDINSDLTEQEMSSPFAALLDARDAEWHNSTWLEKEILKLINKGCKYFVCFGPLSEDLHDSIDDVIINHDVPDITTTFHNNESNRETFDFFKDIAMNEMAHGFVITHNQKDWINFL